MIAALVVFGLLSIAVSVMVLNFDVLRDNLDVPTTPWKEIAESNLTQSSKEDMHSYSWIDRLLRRKINLSNMEVGDDDRQEENEHFTSWESRGGRGSIAIFYNVFMPPSIPASDVANAISIVQEQIDAIARSPISLEPLTLYYNLIGNADAWNETEMKTLCQMKSHNLQCQLIKTYKSASESVTLQAMHDFCHEHPTYRVTYMHTKGAFHDSAKNTHWRKLLTTAALSSDCVKPLDESCNLCGLQFVTQFTFFVPGNMFTADCSYVNKLLSLSAYRPLQEERVKEMLLMKLQNQLRSSLIPDQLDFFGMDRYADEHWIGSHPDVVPCDLDPYTDIAKVFNGTLKTSEFSWKLAPRITGVVGGIGDDRQPSVRNNTDLRQREILLLPGLIHRWWKLYQQMPSPSSWIWKFFPDGEFWLRAIREFGAGEAVDKVTAKYRSVVDGMPLVSGFQSNHNDSVDDSALFVEDGSSINSTAPFHVVFYHIVIPDTDPTSVAEVTRDVMQQLATVSSSSTAPINLRYTVAGGTSIHQSIQGTIETTCNALANVRCQFIGSFDDAFEGESLRILHRYCTQRPDDAVTYIHNMPPPQWRIAGHNQHLIQSLTSAALSQDCRWSVVSSETTCNVCGLIFYNVWTHFFPGNMFTAQCDYVQKLLPPAEFESKMNQLVGEVLLMRLRSIFVTQLFPMRDDILGLHRHSLEYWIGSHPELIPCDLSNETQDLFYWRYNKKQLEEMDFHWGLAPRHAESAPFGFPMRVPEDKSLRLREYSLLPGLLHRWYQLYGKVPAPFSWQWLAAPDGLKWLRATHEYGNQSVIELTADYAKDIF